MEQQQDRGGTRDGEVLPDLVEEHARGTLLPRLVEVAMADPGAVLAGDGREVLTAADLLRRAARVALAVRAVCERGRPVAVLRGHEVGLLPAVVGVVAAGNPLVALDATTPADRLRHYVHEAAATTCVTDAGHAGTASALVEHVLDPDSSDPSDPSGTPPGELAEAVEVLLAHAAQPTDAALLVFTSGSTGAPKGVACDHRSVLHDAWTNARASDCYGRGDVVVHLLSAGFSAGVAALFSPLLVGARQELFDVRRRSVAELPRHLREVGADVLLASPALLRGLVTHLGPGGRLDGLSSVTMAGETVHAAELAALRAVVGPDTVLRNRYGSTETWLLTEFALRAGDPAPSGATPVGRAVPGVRLGVEDEHGRVRASGTGRVVVTSPWLGTRYWRTPARGPDGRTDWSVAVDVERTAASHGRDAAGTPFVRTSDVGTLEGDGVLRLVGRTDHSVKVRGLLVQPGEVDAVLFALPAVREALVVGRPSPRTGRTALTAYVVPAEPGLRAPQVRAAVRERLPAHMVPETVVLLGALPRTDRGKVDRSALVVPAAGAPPVEPRSSWETLVLAQFAAVLEVEELSVRDDFFELGGDSLAAQALLARVADLRDVGDRDLTTELLVRHPTVEAFAAATRVPGRHRRPGAVALRAGGTGTPVFLLAGAGGTALALRALARHLPPGFPVFGLQGNGLENRALPDRSVQRMARRHLHAVRQVQPHGPYRLVGHSLGGLVALEVAQQLRAAGEHVEQLVVLDSFPPDPDSMPPREVRGWSGEVRERVALALTGVLPVPGLGHYPRFFRHGVHVQRRYRTSAYPGRTLVVVAADDADSPLRRRWAGHLSGEHRQVEVAGDHVSILREPHVRTLAAVVGAALTGVVDLREGLAGSVSDRHAASSGCGRAG